ncbi:MAG: MBL fold metallo-hydrolase [Bacilli bacterium]
MNISTQFTYRKLDFDCFEIIAPMKERIYLVLGREKACLIDTGMGIGSLLEIVRKITNLPLIVINTHGHPDHAGGNLEFGEAFVNHRDFPIYRAMVTKTYRAKDVRKIYKDKAKPFLDAMMDYLPHPLPLDDECIIDLGNRKLFSYLIPGHTLGSTVIYDSLSHFLFVGDAISTRDTWLYLSYSTGLVTYRSSLLAFMKKKVPYSLLFSGHDPNEAKPDLFDRRIKLLDDVINRKIIGKKVTTFAGKGIRVEAYQNSLIYDPERIDK